MSEVLTIDTSIGIQKEVKLEPLSLYDENHPMLQMKMPEYTEPLPNVNMNNLITRMKMTMKKFGGIGLSANQCGINTRIFIIGTDDYQIACINPKIVNQSAEISKDSEGCLSYPAFTLKIERPKWVDVEYTDENGKVVQTRLEGLTARCYQHELDHMNGIRFVNHVGQASIMLARQKQQKLIKKIIRNRKNNGLLF